jgi:hypothetical protein
VNFTEFPRFLVIVNTAPLRDVGYQEPAAELASYLTAKRLNGSEAMPLLMDKSEQEDAIRAFKVLHDISVEQAWVLAVVEQIHRARLERDNARPQAPEKERGAPSASETPALLDHAEQVLKRAWAELRRWPYLVLIPDWVDAQVVAYLIERYGFTRGVGSPKRLVSRARIVQWLAKPETFVAELKPDKDGESSRWRDLLLDKVRRALPPDDGSV